MVKTLRLHSPFKSRLTCEVILELVPALPVNCVDVDFKLEGDGLAAFLTENLCSGTFDALILGLLKRQESYYENREPEKAVKELRAWFERVVVK